ncbi:MAG: hypothetical protein A2729_02945 [Candidatus Buchananbacteria bacterium RIFCSPHIGHO2_01_FULL_39_14]|uniref:DUF5671 domain-containing protein n=2 Tax=Candidatus Buchananiibacteriota TaxID=1817903 RepID=A0A1G1YTQ1_9BACT|nr:MAG: hypothetical protein A2729_02945 [Candidatus Buchananbacteria bacterium RIFCSPHIGHO2_01_FULL_39_14]OGY49418.1 MAG: hypothetical protein A3D39_02670 [Candidatus Buchananbacteria bacterium RIFCSPHIGHO2_02_FULL_39_17]OGY55659.1 MAG: hypothetical protein A2912_05635 [Candidatus Buchananbacteria bacterium RIFCSPLOWO2_01_FULL_40_23b]
MEQQLNQTFQTTADKTIKGPKSLFWYLTLFFTLGITAFQVGGLWFQFINKWLPKEVISGMVQPSFDQTALKFAVASIIVATPLYFTFSYLIRRALKNHNLDPKNKIRVWITYIILFLTVAIAVGDLINAIFHVLNGDYTLRFILKSLSILIIISWIFTYYWLELRSENSLTTSILPKQMAGITIAVIVVSFIGSFFVVDSPRLARSKAYDHTRAANLQEIEFSVQNYYYQNQKLPADLETLRLDNVTLAISDPSTDKPYEYRTIDDKNYELCAEFENSNLDVKNREFQPYYSEFAYQKGRNCFTKKVVLPTDLQAKPLPIR